jgi:hypothetical protein
MHHFLSSFGKFLLIGLFLFLLNACGGKPFDYHPETEIPKEPGVFGKEDDGLVIYDSKKKKAEKTSSGPQDVSDQTSSTKPGQSSANEEKLQDYKEFQKYQEWKEWKKSEENSNEVKEFLEWREWKSYQEWKKKNNSSE